MATVGSDLDLVQSRLHDSGTLWPRAELLRWMNDGYRQLLAQSAGFSRLLPLDLPGRFTYALCFPWEDRHTTGTYWFPMLPNFGAARQVTFTWEVEMLEGLTPATSRQAVTQQWERAHSGEIEAHFEFGFPKEHERIRRLAWDDKVLVPTSVREFDEVDDAWMRRVGEPTWWTTGLGRSRTVEVYEIKTDYNQGWELQDYDKGLPRGFTGRTYSVETKGFERSNDYGYTTSGDSDALTRATTALITGLGWRFTVAAATPSDGFCTQSWEKAQLDGTTIGTGAIAGSYAWEYEFGAQNVIFGLGSIRGATSPDRQYLPLVTDTGAFELLGSARDWRSTAKALSAIEVVIPSEQLVEADVPELIPYPFQKYLRYYTLSRAFGRDGEGQKPELAAHYDARFKRGVALLRRLADVAHQDRLWVREETSEALPRPPKVRLPSTFPRV